MTAATILVVEDNPFTRKMVRFALENRGFAVLEAPDGETALRMFEKQRADLVLQDLVLPDIDGFDLVARLRLLPRGGDISILAFSGLLSKLDEARISAVGFDDIIVKPIEPSQLIPIVEAHLRAPQVSERIGQGRRLVLADDNSIQLKLTRFRLEKLGFSIEPACDGREALELARRQVPDGIVADVLMPNLDGFGLALAVRREPSLAGIPLLLVTSSYVDESDRELARRAGANDLILRTPEHRELVQALNTMLSTPRTASCSSSETTDDVERERARRVVHQLERQVAINTGLARRCSVLAAELTVLTGISAAVLQHQDVETALDEALAACFDAAGISIGALYLLDADSSLRVRSLVGSASVEGSELATFFGSEELLRSIMSAGSTTLLREPVVPEARAREILARCAATFAMVVPLSSRNTPIGALFMAVNSEDLDQEDWCVFGQGIGNQIGQALSLARAFEERERAESIAREKSALLQLILDSTAEGVVVTDAEEKFLLWNRAAHQLLPGGDSDALPLVRALRDQPDEEREFCLRPRPPGTEDGEEVQARWVMATARPLRTEAPDPQGQVMVLRDISGQRYAERLEKYSRQLEEANQELDSFSYSVSHDLRAPLRIIDGFSRILLDDHGDALDDGGKSVIAVIRKNTRKMGQLIEDLLEFSRMGRQQLSLGDVEMEKLARTAFDESCALEPGRGIELRLGPLPVASGDRGLLAQVWLNLIGNAVKYSRNRERAVVTVSAASKDRQIVYSVADNGDGFEMEYADKLFGVFQRLHSDAEFEGTGVGLALVQRIVRRHGGRVGAEGKRGEGATFWFSLPAPARRG